MQGKRACDAGGADCRAGCARNLARRAVGAGCRPRRHLICSCYTLCAWSSISSRGSSIAGAGTQIESSRTRIRICWTRLTILVIPILASSTCAALVSTRAVAGATSDIDGAPPLIHFPFSICGTAAISNVKCIVIMATYAASAGTACHACVDTFCIGPRGRAVAPRWIRIVSAASITIDVLKIRIIFTCGVYCRL